MRIICVSVCVFCVFIDSALSSNNLPSGYTELEYIESTGTQYIDTKVAYTNDMTSYIDFQDVIANTSSLFGSSTGACNGIGYYSDGWIARFQNGAFMNNTFTASSTITDTITLSNTAITSKNYQSSWKTRTDTNNCNGNMLVFRVTKGKLLRYTLWSGTKLSFDGIPAIRNSDNKIGMFDLASNSFFTNAGSGNFIAGPIFQVNLLNPNNIHQGTISGVTATKGKVVDDSRRCYIDYIPVKAGDTIWFSAKTNTPPVYQNSWLYSEENEDTFITSIGGASFDFGNYTGYKYTIPSDGYFRGIFLTDAYTFTPADVIDAQIVIQPSAPTQYTPYINTAIQIATTKYVETKFASAVSELNTTMGTIKNVVDNTIIQADRIGKLATGKQNRPAENCPDGAQCLLITEADGSLHWYPICNADGTVGTQSSN